MEAEKALKPRVHYGWVVLGVGTLGVFTSLGMARMGYSMILPAMQRGLGLDNMAAGALATANLTGYLVLALIGGALASRFGPCRVIVAGVFVTGAAMVLTGLARNFPEAMLWRAVCGIGSGATNVPVLGLVPAWFALRRRGLASGIAVSGSSLALITMGPGVPALLAMYGGYGWRVCWLWCGGLGIAIAFLSLALLRRRPQDMGLLPVGAEETAVPVAASGSPAPLDWGAVYKSGAVWHLGIVYVAYGFSYLVYMTFFNKALIAEGGYTTQAAGNLFMMMGWLSLACGLLWGSVSDRIGRKYTMVIIYMIQALSYALFALWPVSAGFTLSAVLFGLTAWSIPAVVAAQCGDMLGARMAPAALGFVTLFLGVGQALGPVVAGAMADATGSYLPAVLLAGGVAVAGAIGAGFLRAVEVCAEE
ncbi:MAG: MFS transporter [Armatimonadia bacterium]